MEAVFKGLNMANIIDTMSWNYSFCRNTEAKAVNGYETALWLSDGLSD